MFFSGFRLLCHVWLVHSRIFPLPGQKVEAHLKISDVGQHAQYSCVFHSSFSSSAVHRRDSFANCLMYNVLNTLSRVIAGYLYTTLCRSFLSRRRALLERSRWSINALLLFVCFILFPSSRVSRSVLTFRHSL